MDFKTDLNERERERFAGILRGMAKQADDAADNLIAERDGEFLTVFLLLTLQMMRGKEISDFMMTQVRSGAEFPETIEEK